MSLGLFVAGLSILAVLAGGLWLLARDVELDMLDRDPELSAARRMREEQRNRNVFHAQQHDARTGWDHR
jgi:hypothetical protein